MIKVIGKESCSRCDMVKDILSKKGKEFEYTVLENLDGQEQTEIRRLAKENHVKAFPLIIKDNKVVQLQEV